MKITRNKKERESETTLGEIESSQDYLRCTIKLAVILGSLNFLVIIYSIKQ